MEIFNFSSVQQKRLINELLEDFKFVNKVNQILSKKAATNEYLPYYKKYGEIILLMFEVKVFTVREFLKIVKLNNLKLGHKTLKKLTTALIVDNILYFQEIKAQSYRTAHLFWLQDDNEASRLAREREQASLQVSLSKITKLDNFKAKKVDIAAQSKEEHDKRSKEISDRRKNYVRSENEEKNHRERIKKAEQKQEKKRIEYANRAPEEIAKDKANVRAENIRLAKLVVIHYKKYDEIREDKRLANINAIERVQKQVKVLNLDLIKANEACEVNNLTEEELLEAHKTFQNLKTKLLDKSEQLDELNKAKVVLKDLRNKAAKQRKIDDERYKND